MVFVAQRMRNELNERECSGMNGNECPVRMQGQTHVEHNNSPSSHQDGIQLSDEFRIPPWKAQESAKQIP